MLEWSISKKLFPLMQKIRHLKNKFIICSSFFALLITLISIKNSIVLHSDMLFFIEFFERVWHYGMSEIANYHSLSTNYFPYAFLFFLSGIFGENYVYRIVFIGVCEIALLTSCSMWLLYKIRPNVKATTLCLLFLCIATQIFVSMRAYTWMYTWSNGAHHGAFVLGFGIFAAFVEYLQSGKYRWLIAVFVILSLCILSTALFTVYVALPLLVTCLGMLLLCCFNPRFIGIRNKISCLVLTTFLGILSGKSLELLFPDRWINTSPDIKTVSQTFYFFISSIVKIPEFMTANNSILLCLLVLSLLVLFIHFISSIRLQDIPDIPHYHGKAEILFSGSPIFLAFCCITFISICASFLAPILTIGSLYAEGSTNNLKYFTQPCMFVVFAALCAFDCFNSKQKYLQIAILLASLFFIATALYAFYSKPSIETNHDVHWDKQETPHYASKWINNLKAQGIPLHDGLATYWESKAVEMFLKDKSRVFTIQNNFLPAHFNNSLRLENKKGTAFFNYILIDKNQKFHQFVVNKEALKNLQNYEILTSPNGKYEILFFKDNSLDLAFKQVYAAFMNTAFVRKK